MSYEKPHQRTCHRTRWQRRNVPPALKNYTPKSLWGSPFLLPPLLLIVPAFNSRQCWVECTSSRTFSEAAVHAATNMSYLHWPNLPHHSLPKRNKNITIITIVTPGVDVVVAVSTVFFVGTLTVLVSVLPTTSISESKPSLSPYILMLLLLQYMKTTSFSHHLQLLMPLILMYITSLTWPGMATCRLCRKPNRQIV